MDNLDYLEFDISSHSLDPDSPMSHLYEYDFITPNAPIKTATCKHCGTKNLKWKMIENKWRLHDQNNNIHQCKEFFEV